MLETDPTAISLRDNKNDFEGDTMELDQDEGCPLSVQGLEVAFENNCGA